MAIFSFLVRFPVVIINIEAFLSRFYDLCLEQSQKKQHSVKYYNSLKKVIVLDNRIYLTPPPPLAKKGRCANPFLTILYTLK